jgi:hypothetical protein
MMMRAATLWAILTLFWGLITAGGLIGVLLEAEGQTWFLLCWAGGVILAVVSARRWQVERARSMPSPRK